MAVFNIEEPIHQNVDDAEKSGENDRNFISIRLPINLEICEIKDSPDNWVIYRSEAEKPDLLEKNAIITKYPEVVQFVNINNGASSSGSNKPQGD